MNPSVHEFSASLDLSHSYADADWWQETYRRAFPGLLAAVSTRSDGWAQRGGIDRVLTLSSGKTLNVDEKVRGEEWPDFALEFWSDHERRAPGWIAKDLACDYIAYAWAPSAKCYLLPFQELRRAWRRHRLEWVRTYRDPDRHVAPNREGNRIWQTWFVPVPIQVVLDAISGSLLIESDSNLDGGQR